MSDTRSDDLRSGRLSWSGFSRAQQMSPNSRPEYLRQMLEESVRRGEAIRLRAQRIDALRIELWRRVDRLEEEWRPASSSRTDLHPRERAVAESEETTVVTMIPFRS